ncbi:MAG: hypothetical protein Q9M36_00030 [Sulfurovum sp.]|nr:hypothetical protein [Sulfurovum sp.]
MIRMSKSVGIYPPKIDNIIQLYLPSFSDIFLHEIHKKTMELDKNPFRLKVIDVYQSLKYITLTYNRLIENTENPEVLKLLNDSQENIDSLFTYLNPNKDNISQVTKTVKKTENQR